MKFTGSQINLLTLPKKIRRPKWTSSCKIRTSPYVNALRVINRIRPSQAISHAIKYLLKLDTRMHIEIFYKYLPQVVISISSLDMLLELEFLDSGDRKFCVDFPNNPHFNILGGLCDNKIDPIKDIIPSLQTTGRVFYA